MAKFTAIVLSGGIGKRMRSQVPKQYLMLRDKPVLAHSLLAFEQSNVDDIVIVSIAGDEDYIRKEFVEKYNITKVSAIVPGGKERYDSVFCGLKTCNGSDYVLIHDGARPYVTDEIIQRNIDEVQKFKAVVTGTEVTDTIKIADDEGYVASTPKRNLCYAVQTPQSFEYGIVLSSYEKYIKDTETGTEVQATDDAQVVALYSDTKVKLIEGDASNIKITNPSDLQQQTGGVLYGENRK